MGKTLFLLFLTVPAIEIALLIVVGGAIGLLPTLAIIFGTAILGASLARTQGLGVVRRLEAELGGGRVPTNEILDGLLLLVACLLLLTPGFLTDLVGFLLLVPGTRALARTLARRAVARGVERGSVRVRFHANPGPTPAPGSGEEIVLDEKDYEVR